jgi:rhodanese-related sulfurtransferase
MMDRTDFFTAKLAYETDASDLYAAQKAQEDIVVIDVRSDEAWAQGRISGAVHMHYSEIATRAPQEISPGTPVVVYCWSPGCNAGAKGALEFAKLGYEVRELIGGFEYVLSIRSRVYRASARVSEGPRPAIRCATRAHARRNAPEKSPGRFSCLAVPAQRAKFPR